MPTLFTQEQFKELEKRIDRTQKELKKLLKEKAGAHEPGDTWHAAPFRIAYVEEVRLQKRLSDLKKLATDTEIIKPEQQNKKADIGNTIMVEYENGAQKKFILDGYILRETKNHVSIYSPLGKVLRGAEKGQVKTVEIGGQSPAFASLPAGRAKASAFGSTKSAHGQTESAGKQKIKILEILPPQKGRL